MQIVTNKKFDSTALLIPGEFCCELACYKSVGGAVTDVDELCFCKQLIVVPTLLVVLQVALVVFNCNVKVDERTRMTAYKKFIVDKLHYGIRHSNPPVKYVPRCQGMSFTTAGS